MKNNKFIINNNTGLVPVQVLNYNNYDCILYVVCPQKN